MKKEHNYLDDIVAIRSMMERSSKFLSLSGWAGIMTGLYALIATYIAYTLFHFQPNKIDYPFEKLHQIIFLACALLLLSLATTFYLTLLRAKKANIQVWNISVRWLMSDMSLPLVAGGVFMIICVYHHLIGLLIPSSLIFYGIGLSIAGNYSYKALKSLGFAQVGLGIASLFFLEWSMLLWALGFGFLHIVYGLYIHQQQKN
jgi:hypothetical protein